MHHDTNVRGIGALAAAAHVTIDTLRFYERQGLIPQATRTPGGFRRYAPETAERLRFIRQARQVGMSLREIRELVEPGTGRCSAVRKVIAARVADVDRRLRELNTFRKTLQIALARCDQALARSKNAACPVVRQLGMEIPSRTHQRRR